MSTSVFSFLGHDCSTELLAWVGEVAMTRTLADSGRLDLRSRVTVDVERGHVLRDGKLLRHIQRTLVARGAAGDARLQRRLLALN